MPNTHEPLVPELPASLPKLGNALSRGIGCMCLRLLGWRVAGELPDVRRAIFAAAPHTSNWDFIVAMAGMLGLGIKLSYLMKKEAFFWPFKRLFLALGGIPLDRQSTHDTVEQLAQWFASVDQAWLAITPEGTRTKVNRWKTGFLCLASIANVPVVLVGWDYPTKTIYIDKIWPASGDHVQDAEAIRAYMNRKFTGKHLERQ